MSYLDYAARGENAGWRYAAGVAAGVLLAVGAGVVILLSLRLLGLPPADFADQLTHATRPAPFFLANGAVFALLLGGVAGGAALFNAKRFGDIVGRWRWRLFMAGAGLWGVVLIGLTLIDLAIAPHGFSLSATAATPGLFVAALVGLGVQTFTEEFVFRGYLTQGLLLATRRPAAAAVVSGLIFGSVHIPNGWPQAINAVVFGVILALIAIRTGGIAFTAGLHLANNLFGAAVVVSGGDVFKGSPGLFTQNTPQLMWWDVVTASLALAGVVWLAWRREPEP